MQNPAKSKPKIVNNNLANQNPSPALVPLLLSSRHLFFVREYSRKKIQVFASQCLPRPCSRIKGSNSFFSLRTVQFPTVGTLSLKEFEFQILKSILKSTCFPPQTSPHSHLFKPYLLH
ncbi:hypothetical protein AABB24_013033 [Solanum stoloniferum]|uniref:Uncharacterized protein n=1 Tax=Solanum stoloniferum TaxID=62892 RepID=A0ABD2U6N5_9SOLN